MPEEDLEIEPSDNDLEELEGEELSFDEDDDDGSEGTSDDE